MAEPRSCASGFVCAADLDDPAGLAALVGQQAELRHEAGDRAHQLDNARVAVAARAEHRVGVHDGRALGPGEHVALFGLVADLVEIAGAGVAVVGGDAQAAQLLLIGLLVGVHDLFEHEVLRQGGGDPGIERPGVGGEFLRARKTAVQQLVVELVDGLDGLEAEGNDRMAVLARHGHHALGAEGVAVHDEGLHDLGHGLAPGAVQQGLLLRCQDQVYHSFCKIFPYFSRLLAVYRLFLF